MGLTGLCESVRKNENESIDIIPKMYGFEIVATYEKRIAALISQIKQNLIVYGPDYRDDLKVAQLRKHANLEKKEETRGVYFPKWGGIENRNKNIYNLKVVKIDPYQSLKHDNVST